MLERAALLGELVLHAHRRLGNHDPRDDPFRLQLTKTLRQHPVADVRNPAPELGEAHPAVQEELDHGARPSAADELDGTMKPRAQVGFEAHSSNSTKIAHLTQSTYFYIVT